MAKIIKVGERKKSHSQHKVYISTTFEPEHDIPFQESSQGSPPSDFQPSNWEGEFMLLYMTLRADTETKKGNFSPCKIEL